MYLHIEVAVNERLEICVAGSVVYFVESTKKYS